MTGRPIGRRGSLLGGPTMTQPLRKLPDYRGDSQFSTWAYKFALYEAAAKVRKRAWQAREVPLEPTAWPLVADRDTGPGRAAESRELLRYLQEAIAHDLSPPEHRWERR